MPHLTQLPVLSRLLLLTGAMTALLLPAAGAHAADAAPVPAALPLADITGAPPCPADVMADLHNADFLTVRNLKAKLPRGEMVIERGVVATFKDSDKRTAGVVVGDIDLNLTMPSGPGTYVALPPSANGQPAMQVKARMSYLDASLHSQVQLQHGGEFIAAMRHWNALSAAEQAQFESVYRAAWADGWLDDAATAQAGHPVLRTPVQGEVYGALWLSDVPGMPADQLTRIDLKVQADGTTTSAREHRSGLLLMQSPYPPVSAGASQPGAIAKPPA